MRAQFTFGLLAFTLLACHAAADNVKVDEKEIIEKAIKAHGGADNLAKFKAVKMKGKGTIDLLGNEVEFTADIQNLLPDKTHAEIRFDVGGQQLTVTQIFNGKKGWIATNDVSKEAEEDELKSLRNDAHANYLESILPLRDDKSLTVKSIGREKVNDKLAFGLKVTAKDRGEVKLYFDKDSGLLVKQQRKTKGPEEGEVEAESYYSAYKAFSGVQQAMKQLVHHDGKKYLEFEVTDVKMLEKLDDSTFEQP